MRLLSSLYLASAATALVKPDVSASSIAALNASTHGRVHANLPFALPCFTSYNGRPYAQDMEQCAIVQDNYTSADFRIRQANGYMNNQGDMCFSEPDNQCLLNDNNPGDLTVIQNRTCGQGILPDYYLDVHDANDVTQAFHFARLTRTPLTVKNTGHDYLTRSSGKGALALWVHHLKTLRYDASFVPDGCPAAATFGVKNTITTGAGVVFDEAYRFADKHGMTMVGGYHPTVGTSGGYPQTAGHSVLSPVYGLAVDRVVQYKVVTPDGQHRVANACQNPDLFWALRGGGGNTFGVVLESTHRLEPNMPLTGAVMEFEKQGSNMVPFLDIVVNNSLRWGQEGWGGHVNDASFIYVTPLLSVQQAEQSMSELAAFTRSQGGKAVIKQYPSFLAFYEEHVIANAVEVGRPRSSDSRIMPESVFASEESRRKLMEYFKETAGKGRRTYIPATLPQLYNATSSSDTSVHPAWRHALWSFGPSVNITWGGSFDDRVDGVRTLTRLANMLEEIAPNSGGYLNEASPFQKNWQEAWWGKENYARLLAIKQKYDPNRLLKCWKCVGWTPEDVDDSCYSAYE